MDIVSRRFARSLLALAAAALVAVAGAARAEDGSGLEEDEHAVVVGVGGAAELDLHERALHVGPSVFVEWEAIDRWLELELGASIFASEGGVEAPVDWIECPPLAHEPL